MYSRDESGEEPYGWWRMTAPAIPATPTRSAATRVAESRRFLAEEVYRVPAEWLDEVLRVRMADLER